MIDFDEMDASGADLVSRVASCDDRACPRGECSCCDCLGYLSKSDTAPGQPPPRPYNVIRRPELLLGDPSAQLCKADKSWNEYCQGCGCHAFWHGDLSITLARASAKGLVVEAQTGWGHLEKALFCQTSGAFPRNGIEREPGKREPTAAKERWKISVICPTNGSRQQFHPFLYRWFCHQTHFCKELVIVDTGLEGASDFFTLGPPAGDPRVLYQHFDDSDARWSIGTKRNVACYFASGDVIVHFDDDDIYAPTYLAVMLQVLRTGHASQDGEDVVVRITDYGGDAGDDAAACVGWARPGTVVPDAYRDSEAHRLGQSLQKRLRSDDMAAEAVTFSRWYTYNVEEEVFGVCDVDKDQGGLRSWTYGYGFSFAYTRDVWRARGYRDMDLCEDRDFFESILARGARVAIIRDSSSGLCSHTRHESNFSPWELDRPVASTCAPQALVALGSKLSAAVVRGVKCPAPVFVCTGHDLTLSREDAIKMNYQIVAEFTKESFQKRLHAAWKAASGNPAKQATERRRVCLEVQGPIVSRYGFENSLDGVLLSTEAYKVHHYDQDPDIQYIGDFALWLANPQKQSVYPIEQELICKMITSIGKVRRWDQPLVPKFGACDRRVKDSTFAGYRPK